MLGAIIGDIAGSRFEWHNHKSKDFELTDENRYTAKIHFKCKCDRCGYETFLTYDPDTPSILY